MEAPRIVVLAGTPTQLGLRHGQLLAGEIRFLIGRVHHHIFRRVGRIQGLGVQIIAHAFGLAMNRYIPPRLREEMKATAAGSGVRYADILLLNTLDDVLNILRRLAPRTPSVGCSSFALFGRRSQDGLLLHGRNLDYHFRGTPIDDGGSVAKLLHQSAVLFVCRPHGCASFLSLGWPGLVGTSTAISQEGISLGNLTSYVRGTSPMGTPTTILYRMALEEASTLRQLGNTLRAARRTMGNILMVGSGRENAATLFEVTRGSVEEVEPDRGMLVSTNHFVSPALARRQRPFLLPHSVARWQRLRALCDRDGVTPRDALGFLGDVGCGDGERAQSIFARVANEGTAVSVLFRPTEMELWLGVSDGPPASRGEFRRIDVGDLLSKPIDE